MSDNILSIILAVAVIIEYIIIFIISMKQQSSESTAEIQNLARQLGVSDDQTFRTEFTNQYSTIITNIGKSPNDRTLTGQHNDILKVIEKNFEELTTRYEQEDKNYRQFALQLLDIKETLNNISKVIAYNQEIYHDACKLREENDSILKENQKLESQLEIKTAGCSRTPQI